MSSLIVVETPSRWPFDVPGVEVVAARDYLTDAGYSPLRRAKVFNLCRDYSYQSVGYYVSLLAEARGHRPKPDIRTIQEMKSQTILRVATDELDDLIQRSLAPLKSDEFLLSIYFGQNTAERYRRLSLRLSSLFDAPLLRAKFVRNQRWTLTTLQPIASSGIPMSHRPEVARFAAEYFAGRQGGSRRRATPRYELAILVNPADADGDGPSNRGALRKFERAAQELGIGVTFVTKDDYSRLGEFDALFLRETTQVNHHTYRFAQRAAAEGLVVIDDPQSIVRCTNKVYLAELFERHKIPAPRTMVVHADNIDAVAARLGLPCVLKRPDSSFSQGVVKVEGEPELKEAAAKILAKTSLFIAQEFLPTEFDWRIGVLDGEALYACRYHMAKEHWQIIRHEEGAEASFGDVDTVPLGEVPKPILRTAVRAAKLIGNSLYGVDMKLSGKKPYVIEVNDNPSIDSGYEDKILGDMLYRRILEWFVARMDRRAAGEMRA